MATKPRPVCFICKHEIKEDEEYTLAELKGELKEVHMKHPMPKDIKEARI